MRFIKWSIITVFWLSVGSVLYYSLPQRDIVQIKGTEILRADLSGWNRVFYAQSDSGNDATFQNRDLRLINTRTARERPYVFRNEDTGFGWPFYFKLDSSNLQAEAQSVERDEWYAVTHYGLRSEFLSIYPNAISIKRVIVPDAQLIPWFNIVFLAILAAVFWAVWVRWRRFRVAKIDPLWDEVDESVDGTRTRILGWLGR